MRDLFMQVTAEIFPPQQPPFAEMSPVEFDSHASLQIYVYKFILCKKSIRSGIPLAAGKTHSGGAGPS
jgi:hypothetical protein